MNKKTTATTDIHPLKRSEVVGMIARYVYNPDNILKCGDCPFNLGEANRKRTGCGVDKENCWIKLYCYGEI